MDENSATAVGPEALLANKMPLDRDHRTLVRFDTDNDPECRVVMSRLARSVQCGYQRPPKGT